MKTKYTPGPWIIINGGNQANYVRDSENIIDICDVHKAYHESEANTKLIAAAPELLEALNVLMGYRNIFEGYLNSNRDPQADGDGPFKLAESAIKKATL